MTLLSCAAKRGGTSKKQERARRRAGERIRKLLYMKPPISGRGIYGNSEEGCYVWKNPPRHKYSCPSFCYACHSITLTSLPLDSNKRLFRALRKSRQAHGHPAAPTSASAIRLSSTP